jgi:carnitine O-palmitoyltransferase 2
MLWGPAENRWVDKSFSIIIKPDGSSGLNFEHAWGDGACVLSYFNKGISIFSFPLFTFT